ncbi:PAX3- and PAX7-binding protein 1-like [Montipora foliosa]|uniref:PAX3- and PAX7-binding protein 1-like n=1 Tax=Montipora foliosa TaxID=591990 RepID=UPI0035F127AF
MATMFKKHSRRNFRKKIVDEDDENENNGESENVLANAESVFDNLKSSRLEKSNNKGVAVTSSNPLLSFSIDDEISKPKEKAKSKIKAVTSSNSLLSFDDEIEDESEVFKVKKSKESRRLAKKIELERKKKDKIDDKKIDENVNHDQRQDDTDEKLAALRAELSQMAADDDDEVEEKDDTDSVGSGSIKKEQITNSNVKTVISDISIPDAATIHAARKRREMARQTEQEFIPLDDTKRYEGQFATQGRLVREDENDISDEEDEEGVIRFSVARKRGAFPALDRRREMEAALSNQELEEKSDNEEAEDEELKLWEDEQIRKGVKGVSVPITQPEGLQATDVTNTLYQQGYTEDTPSALHFQQEQPYLYGMGYSELQANGNQMYGPAMTYNSVQARHVVTVDMISDKMKQQLASLKEVHRGHEMEMEKATSQLETAQGNIKKLERQGRNAEQRFSFFQEMKGYVRDLIECLNNKVPEIDELERSMHALLKNRATNLVQRRQLDVKDQAQDYLNAQTGKQGQNSVKPADQAKLRRVAEREGRRARRRKHREKEKKGTQTETHHEGQSTDDEETETDSIKFRAETKKILSEEKAIFEDVVEDFSSIDSIKSRFEEWKNKHEDCYRNAYISLCLPKLFAPFIRLQLLDWNPFEAKCLEIEEFRWYKSLVLFGCGDDPYDIDVDDPDVKLIPSLLEKSVIPKLTGLFEHVWDPLSTKQTTFAIKLIRGMAEVYPNFHAQDKTTQSLFAAITSRLRRCVSDDVYVPLYPKSLLDNKSCGALPFFQRQFWSCVKLMGNILLWEGLLSSGRLQEMAIDGLLNRYLLLALQHSHLYYDSLEKTKAIVGTLPKQWFSEQQQKTVPSLEALARYLATLAGSMQRSSAGCPEAERKKARNGIKKVIQLLVQLRSVDKARLVAKEHNMEEQVKDI